MFRHIVLAAGFSVAMLMTLPIASRAEDATVGALKISAAWARATPKGAPVGGAYMTIINTGTTPDRLVGGTTPVASKFEIHQMSMDKGVMKMRPVAGGLEIKPGETVTLKPAGYHVMLMGLKQPLRQGEHFKATLSFEKAGKVDVDYAIAGIGASGPLGAAHGADHKTMPGMHMK
jgi:copper(I)-binding protein